MNDLDVSICSKNDIYNATDLELNKAVAQYFMDFSDIRETPTPLGTTSLIGIPFSDEKKGSHIHLPDYTSFTEIGDLLNILHQDHHLKVTIDRHRGVSCVSIYDGELNKEYVSTSHSADKVGRLLCEAILMYIADIEYETTTKDKNTKDVCDVQTLPTGCCGVDDMYTQEIS